ncbi:hypothetical protein [Candidatus Mycoplasma haematohominis]|uniref:Uncharacterized protein n=1 Tax=Candidatus Mycoplasma haematohominis TaxID=1494318 RepID=A0A478FTN6_9MOLU|nr:hypothetical protein [Candidatus Mycoplasma haemohominis]GCE63706.1 hypothetical protein MHSWG343_07060 [Candidatus Mycoplasma haemohominis]
MSTQAIGSAIAGTAVVGGGGTLAAYAAGAFDPSKPTLKEATFEDYAKHKSLKYLGETNKVPGIAPDSAKIKSRLDDSTNGQVYRASFNKHWDNMKDADVTVTPKKTRPSDLKTSLFPTSGSGSKDQEVSNWTADWCKSIGVKKVLIKKVENGKESWKDDLDEDSSWKAFKDICLAGNA